MIGRAQWWGLLTGTNLPIRSIHGVGIEYTADVVKLRCPVACFLLARDLVANYYSAV